MDNEEFLDWLEANPTIEWNTPVIERLYEITGICFFGGVIDEVKPGAVRYARECAIEKVAGVLRGSVE